MPISIDMLANVQPFLRGTKDVEGALEDVSDSLDDVARDAQRSSDKIERELGGSADVVGDSTEKLERKFKDLRDTVQRESKSGGDAMSRSYKRATDDSSESLDEFKRESNSTAKESAASFDGSAESIVDSFQEIAANAFAGFGPAGAAAGIAAALGIGYVTTELQKQQEEAEETKQSLIEMYQGAIEEGRNYIDEAQILARYTELVFDDAKMEEFRKSAEQIGVDINTYTRAQAGSYDDLQLVIEAAKKAEEERGSAVEVNSKQGQAMLLKEQEAVAGIIRENEGLLEQHDKNRQAAELVAEARAESEQKQRDQINRTRDADQARYEAAARRYGVPLPTAVVPVTADTAAADRAMRDFTSRRYRLKVDIEGRLANGQRII